MKIEEEVEDFLKKVLDNSQLFDGVIDTERINRDFEEDKVYGVKEYSYKLAWGATRIVLIPCNEDYSWVIKIPFKGKKDYCQIESEIYDAAIAANLAEFFAEEKYICEFKGNHIYMQERAEIDANWCFEEMQQYYYDNYDRDEFLSQHEYLELEDYITSLASGDDYQPVEDLIVGIFDAADRISDLQDFIYTYEINDIHYANIGFQDGLPLFIDYAGYAGR